MWEQSRVPFTHSFFPSYNFDVIYYVCLRHRTSDPSLTFFYALPHIRTYALESIILYELRRFATMHFTKEQVNQQKKKKKGTADVASTRQW